MDMLKLLGRGAGPSLDIRRQPLGLCASARNDLAGDETGIL
jgi:hypothetical protein